MKLLCLRFFNSISEKNIRSVFFLLNLVLAGCVLSIPLHASIPLDLTNKNKVYLLDSSFLQQWDPVLKKASPVSTLYLRNPIPHKDFWYTVKLSNPSKSSIEWYLVSYNYSIDLIDVFAVSDDGQVEKYSFRDSISIYDRPIQHKQPVFPVLLKPGQTKTYYLRINNESVYDYVFAVYSHERFFSHFFKEYLLYGLFYGLILFVFLYNIMYYLLLREKVVLFYCMFIFSQMIHMLFRDGNGLYIIPGYTEYADLIKNLSRGALSITLLLYTAYFLKIDVRSRLFKWIIGLIIFRAVYTLIMLRDTTQYTFHIELFFILFCTYLSVRSYKNSDIDVRHMAIGLIILSASYFLYYTSIIFSSALGAIGFFAMYYGVACESIFMTLALTERFKRLKLESFKQVQMNKELEEMVDKRTELIGVQNKLLEERSDELNLFLYSASHDLKGPLKTIEGLCNIGLTDGNVVHPEIYNLIKRKLKNLESNISDLNSVTKLRNEHLPLVQIDFNAIEQEMEERFQFFEGFKDCTIHFSNTLTQPFYADQFSIKCIYQNIFENALKYRDPKKKSELQITIRDTGDQIELKIKDNGLGISEKSLPRIFDMFYRGNEEARNDTGLGLFIVKLAVAKLGGSISVESRLGQGTAFVIVLPKAQG